jgi:putative tryptophan/tyrosine transport system substrate-binding protein
VRRREFITLVSGVIVACPVVACAQQQPTMPVIGFLHYGSAKAYAHIVSAVRQGLRESGFIEGQNVAVEYRWADGQYDRLPALAGELVQRQVLAIVAAGVVAAEAAKAATTTIPIVFSSGADPIAAGIVASLNRPGGNATGVSVIAQELAAKRLQLLRELVPHTRLIAMLINPDNPGGGTEFGDVEAAARALGLQLRKVTATNESEINAAFVAIATPRVDGLIVGQDGYFVQQRDQIAGLAARYGIPAIYAFREHVVAGGLISYASSLADGYRQVGLYVGKILNGAKPADLPVIQPTKFELIINLKTANALTLPIPPLLLARADEVIE